MFRVKSIILILTFLIVSFYFSQSVLAAPAYGDGTYTDDFSDSTGISTRTRTKVDTSVGQLKLTNASGTFIAPFYATGTAVMVDIRPTSVVSWGAITLNATIPTSTSITAQILDGAGIIYPDTLLPGNSVGFSSFPLDISSLPVDRSSGAGGGKIYRLTIKFYFTTSDTNITPAIDSFTLSYITKQGDLSASTLASTPFPESKINNKSTGHSGYYSNPSYPAVRWVKDMGTFGGGDPILSNNELYYNTGGAWINSNLDAADGGLFSINKNTGQTIWQRQVSSADGGKSMSLSLSANNTLYTSDIYNDTMTAYDATNGSLKWTYQFNGGHTNSEAKIADDGTIYTSRENTTIIKIYAFNPDGSTKWIYSTSTNYASDIKNETRFALTSDRLFFGISTSDSGTYAPTDHGRLYALNPVTGELLWTYDTGNISASLVADTDGTVYAVNNSSNSIDKKIFAINSDGTLKWQFNTGLQSLTYSDVLLRSDGVLLLSKYAYNFDNYPTVLINTTIEARSTTDGHLLWSRDFNNMASLRITDSQNGLYVSNLYFGAGNPPPTISYIDANNNLKWQLASEQDNLYNYFFDIALDENGRFYTTLDHNPGFDNTFPGWDKLFAVYPWSISYNTNANGYNWGDTVTFTATTTMQQINLLTGASNKIQILLSDNTKIPLTYSTTTSDGNTVWVGTYNTTSTNSGYQNIPFTIEGSQASITTDTTTHFNSPAELTNNTGYVVSGSFNMYSPAPVLGSISPLIKMAGDPQFTLTLNGSNFYSSSTAQFAGTPLSTTYINPNQLTAVVPANNIIFAGTFNITVSNPTPGGGVSNTVGFISNSGGGSSGGGGGGSPIFIPQISTSTPTSTVNILNTNIIPPKITSNEIILQFSGATTSTSSTTLPSAKFTYTLKKGMRNNDVKRLQQLLATDKEVYPEGSITGYFGSLTEKAVGRFQLKYKVILSIKDTGYGIVGVKTRAKLLEIFGK